MDQKGTCSPGGTFWAQAHLTDVRSGGNIDVNPIWATFSCLSGAHLLPHLHDFWHFAIAYPHALKKEVVLEKWPSLMDSNTFKSSFPGNLAPEQPEIYSLPIQRWIFAGSFPLIIQDFEFDYFTITMAKMATSADSPMRPSLFTSNKSHLVISLTSCIKKLSSRCLKNHQDLFVSAVSYSQLTSDKLKPSIWLWAADLEVYLSSFKTNESVLSSWLGGRK